MLLTYKEARKQVGSRSELARALESGAMRRIARNLYATDGEDSMLEALSMLYPEAIATGQTALYLQGLIDSPPDVIELATKRGGTKISNPAIRQSFIPQEWLRLGASTLVHDGAEVRVYDRERMLLELMRSRSKMPYDIYREAVGSYRKLADELDIYKLEEYAASMPRGGSYLGRVLEEVF